MLKKEIYNIKDKNSQEILLHLQRKSILNKNTSFLEEFKTENKRKFIKINENNEFLPPTRMKQFINNSFISKSNNKQYLSSSISKETKDITISNNTPKFNEKNSPKENDIYKDNINKECYSQFSFSEKINNNKPVNYLNYHLHENLERDKCNKEEIRHLYLPKKYKDDEKYKSNLYKYLKDDNRSNIIRERGNKTKSFEIENNNICKKRKFLSVKKKDTNKIIFFNNNVESKFNLFKDDNIGIEKSWQLPIIYQKYDNDVDSDEEQINKGEEKMMYDLRLAIIKWSQNKNICFNYRYLDRPIFTENIKRYSISV